MSLEELNYIFDTPTSKHVKYQTQIVLPWAINKITPGRPYEPPPDPPHRWARYEDQPGEDESIQMEQPTRLQHFPGVSDTDSSSLS